MDHDTGSSSSRKQKTSLSTPNWKIEMKLLINKKEQKVLYAEAGKEFIDFLFSLMLSPLGQVIKVFQNQNSTTTHEMFGSIGNLYNSITTLNKTNYLESSENLDSILNQVESPQLAFPLSLIKNIGTTDSVTARRKENGVYFCDTHNLSTDTYVADDPNSLCPDCKDRMMTRHVKFIYHQEATSRSGSGFVKAFVPYMVMDNLEVKPLSTVSTLALLNSFGIRDLTSLQEMVVHVGAAEGLKLLEESMKSKNVLTSVFLAKRSKEEDLNRLLIMN